MKEILTASNSNHKFNGLNGLKVIAMLAIFYHHSNMPAVAIDLGARGCELFFVCSGFLVGYKGLSSNYYDCSWKGSLTYTYKKFLKMYPLHLITLGIYFVFSCVTNGFSILKIHQFVMNLFVVHAWSTSIDTIFAFNGVSWFLSALLFCYFTTPIFILMFKRFRKKAIFAGIAIIAIRFYIEYLVNNYPDSVLNISVHVNPVVRCLEYALGIFTAYCFLNISWSQKYSTIFEIASVGLLVVIAAFLGNTYRVVYVLIFCMLIAAIASDNGIISKALSTKPFQILNKIQYEFYLIHYVIINRFIINILKALLARVIDNSPMIDIITAATLMVITIVVSFVYKKFFEKPINKSFEFLMNKVLMCLGITNTR